MVIAEPAAFAGPAPARVPVVGLGASAGGLNALGEFLARVPPASGMAYAVVQHLDPTHKAMLAQLLQRTTPMPVREALAHTRIEPDKVYVIPPNKALTLRGDLLQLAAPGQPRGLRRPIDELFESLARERGADAIGVVLSGMGSDGTAGLQSIRAQGGLTLAQQPDTAQFDSMPRSALAAGCVEIVALPGEMPAAILAALAQRAAGQGRAGSRALPAASEPGPIDALTDVLDLLHRRGRHDFRLYKRSTMLRRIERRMGIHHLPSLSDYARMLRSNEQELDLLVRELLIGVTGFFRDKAVWQALKDRGLPGLLEARADGSLLRAWVPGCSTGEEACTLAMVFREVLDALPARRHSTLQIFATDLSADAIHRARCGLYPATIAGELSPERLARFFVPQDRGYRVTQAIRETIVYATHDLTVDPPFTRLDLLSCRNLLIYLTAALQKRLFPLFHFSLRPGGLLLLGSSETVGRHGDLFEPIDLRQRLYPAQRCAAPGRGARFPAALATPGRSTDRGDGL